MPSTAFAQLQKPLVFWLTGLSGATFSLASLALLLLGMALVPTAWGRQRVAKLRSPRR